MSVISSSKFLSCLTWESFTVSERDVGSLLSKAGQNVRCLCRIMCTLREPLCTNSPDGVRVCWRSWGVIWKEQRCTDTPVLKGIVRLPKVRCKWSSAHFRQLCSNILYDFGKLWLGRYLRNAGSMRWVLAWRGCVSQRLLSVLTHLSVYLTVIVPAQGRIYREAKECDASLPLACTGPFQTPGSWKKRFWKISN
jgi:hypothetical protein